MSAGAGTSAAPHTLIAFLLKNPPFTFLHPTDTFTSDSEDEDGGAEGHRILIPPALHALMLPEDRARLKVEFGGDDSITLSGKTLN